MLTVFAPTAYCLQSINKQVFEKAVRCASLTEPQSRSLFNFLCGNDTFVLLPTGHQKSLIYQICPAVARELASTEKNFLSELMVVVISPLISLSLINKFQCKMGLTGQHDSYGLWHLYICRLLFGLSTFFVASLLFMKGTSYCVIRRN